MATMFKYKNSMRLVFAVGQKKYFFYLVLVGLMMDYKE